MYWVQKHSIFNRYKRPVPGGNIIDKAMFQFIDFGPIVFSLGSLTWSNFLPDGEPKYALVPNLISCGVALITFIFPYHKFISKIRKSTEHEEQLFS